LSNLAHFLRNPGGNESDITFGNRLWCWLGEDIDTIKITTIFVIIKVVSLEVNAEETNVCFTSCQKKSIKSQHKNSWCWIMWETWNTCNKSKLLSQGNQKHIQTGEYLLPVCPEYFRLSIAVRKHVYMYKTAFYPLFLNWLIVDCWFISPSVISLQIWKQSQ
jgi:hypothetical protein